LSPFSKENPLQEKMDKGGQRVSLFWTTGEGVAPDYIHIIKLSFCQSQPQDVADFVHLDLKWLAFFVIIE